MQNKCDSLAVESRTAKIRVETEYEAKIRELEAKLSKTTEPSKGSNVNGLDTNNSLSADLSAEREKSQMLEAKNRELMQIVADLYDSSDSLGRKSLDAFTRKWS